MSRDSQAPREPVDPLALWRDWLVQSERQWNALLNELMSSDQFSESMGRMMDLYISFQKSVNESLGRLLTGLNVPTRSDLVDVGERLAAVEDRLARIESLLAERGGATGGDKGTVRRPSRTRRPPGEDEPRAG